MHPQIGNQSYCLLGQSSSHGTMLQMLRLLPSFIAAVAIVPHFVPWDDFGTMAMQNHGTIGLFSSHAVLRPARAL